MDPKHTWLFFDCRPMKAAVRHLIDEVQEGRCSPVFSASALRELSGSVPGLSAQEFTDHMSRLLARGDFGRARKLVGCLDDRTFRAWVIPAAKVLWMTVKLGMLAAFVWFVVWMAT